MALQPSFSFASSSSSSSSFGNGFSYDVFLSFRGPDTRYGFTGNLNKALRDKGIHTFFDDQELEGGEEITPTLVKAIKESRIAIAVFSTNYASSSFCLVELAKIIECFKAKGRLVLPVFYNVDPSHVRHQRGSYEEAMAKHEKRFKDDMEKVQKWRMALHQVASLSGYHFIHGDGYEHKFIDKIVEAVSRKIKRVILHVAHYPVGLEYQVSKVTSLMDVGTNYGVHVVGIHGIEGIGKSTLAREVYNRIADHFECSCFLENVREISNKKGLVHLQNMILSELLGGKKIKLTGVKQGISVMQRRLQKKKVLLILDDVDDLEQLQSTVGKLDCFGPGSRVIITTWDKQLLTSHGVERTYEVQGLDEIEARKLLSWKAFKTVNVDPCYANVLNRVVTYACGLPVALEMIGSNLFGENGKSVDKWESALDQYEKIPIKKIYMTLKVSFDALEEQEQNVFLDVACCFKGYALEVVEDILRAHHGGSIKYQIGVLVEKSLVKIDQFDKVTLHNLIEDMGKEIVRRESPKKPGSRSRLWFHKDIIQVLEDKKVGTAEIEIIYLDFPSSKEEKEVEWDEEAFKKMKNLKTLIIKNGHFLKGPTYLPNSLRVLEWWKYPSESLPDNFHPKNLCILKLPMSSYLSLNLASSLKNFVMLKVLHLDYNKCLTEIPDVSGLPNLEELSFRNCENLTAIHNSVGVLDKLKILNAWGCSKVRSFPPIKLPSLETLHLSYCSSLENFPEVLGEMENITQLVLEGTCIKDLSLSFRYLTRLRRLVMRACRNCMIPSISVTMQELVEMVHSEHGERSSKPLFVSPLSNDFLPRSVAWHAAIKNLDLFYYNIIVRPATEGSRYQRELLRGSDKRLSEVRGTELGWRTPGYRVGTVARAHRSPFRFRHKFHPI